MPRGHHHAPKPQRTPNHQPGNYRPKHRAGQTGRNGDFLFLSDSPVYRFEADFDDAAPLPTGDSYGGWAVVSIPNRLGLVEWNGVNPMAIDITFILDRSNESWEESPGLYCQQQFDRMEKLAGRHSRTEEPPTFLFDSGGRCPHDWTLNPRWRWVVETLEWDPERFIINDLDRPIRIAGTVTIRQYNSAELMEAYKGPAKRNRDKHKDRKKDRDHKNKYTVKPGDTLQKIASKELDDPKRWRDIADLNDIRHPSNDSKLKPGNVLKMPSK